MPVNLKLTYTVSDSGSYRGIDLDVDIVLSADIDQTIKNFWPRLRSLLYLRVKMPRPIGFTSQWFMEGDDWKATW